MTHRLVQVAISLIGSVALLLGPLPSVASDDDEQPAYMIYIDPETGKYTTEDPLAPDRDTPAPDVTRTESAIPAPAAGAPWLNRYAAVAAALVILLVLVGRRLFVQRSSTH